MNFQSEFEFLNDQVTRLNGQLSYYQDMYIDKSEKMGSNSLKMIFNNHSAPLLAEYDKIIYELTVELSTIKDELDIEHTKTQSIVNENERLWEQMKMGTLNTTLDVTDKGNVSSSEDKNSWNLQIEVLKKEKQTMEDMQKLSDREIERLQSQIDELTSKPEVQIFNEQVSTIRHDYQMNVAELHDQITSLKDKNRDLTNELDQLRDDYLNLDRESRKYQEELAFEKQSHEESLSQVKGSMRRIEFLEEENQQLQMQIDDYKSNLKGKDNNLLEWNTTMKNLESRLKEKELQNNELRDKFMEMKSYADSSDGRVREVEIRETQLQAECERLRGVISGILDDAGARTRHEIDVVQQHYDQDVARVVDELNFCEQNRQELIAEVDQIKRSKTLLEEEMEKYHRVEKDRGMEDCSSTEQLYTRAINAEREREQLKLDLSSCEQKMDQLRWEFNRAQDNQQLELSDLREKLARAHVTLDKSQRETERYAKLLASNESTSGSMQRKLQQQLKNARQQHAMLKQQAELDQKELQQKLTASEQLQRKYQDEMRYFLTKQHHLGETWREEAHSISEDSRQKISQLTKEMDRLKERSSQMQDLLQESRQKLMEAEESITDKTKLIGQLEERIKLLDDDCCPNHSYVTTREQECDWQLKQLRKQQQKIVKETVARKNNLL